MTETKYYLVKSGPVLKAIKDWVKLYQAAHRASLEYVHSHGYKRWMSSRGGRLIAIGGPGEFPDFKKANSKGVRWPKHNTVADKEIRALPEAPEITEHLNKIIQCPLSISYTYPEGSGSGSIGACWEPVGVAFYDPKGPFMVWMPDYAGILKRRKAEMRGKKAKFKKPNQTGPHLEGLQEILREEWDLMDAKHKLGKK